MAVKKQATGQYWVIYTDVYDYVKIVNGPYHSRDAAAAAVKSWSQSVDWTEPVRIVKEDAQIKQDIVLTWEVQQ